MSDNLQKYLPEFDDDEVRSKLSGFAREELVDLLVRAYKEKRLIAKMHDEQSRKVARITEIRRAPSELRNMLGVPTAEDLRKLIDDDEV